MTGRQDCAQEPSISGKLQRQFFYFHFIIYEDTCRTEAYAGRDDSVPLPGATTVKALHGVPGGFGSHAHMIVMPFLQPAPRTYLLFNVNDNIISY